MNTLLRYVAFASLAFATIPSLAEEPRGYIGRPLEASKAYSQRAQDAYAAGVWTLDEIAASEADAASSQRIYERAQQAFEEAVAAEPGMYEAHTYLGYIHRKLGRFDLSLAAYRRALELKPDFVHAIEYQGEAYLGLGDFERARLNFLRLYALDQTLAQKLLTAMHDWSRQPKHADSPQMEAARAWLAKTRARD